MKDINNAVFSCTITEIEEIINYSENQSTRMKVSIKSPYKDKNTGADKCFHTNISVDFYKKETDFIVGDRVLIEGSIKVSTKDLKSFLSINGRTITLLNRNTDKQHIPSGFDSDDILF